jgi:UDP:flavonoid glycosyltransferase YjiC (YdhE family)
VAERRRLSLLLGAFGDPGHAFPLIALGCALRARSHEVTVQTSQRWQLDIEREGLQFAPMSEYSVFPTRTQPRSPYAAAVGAARETAVLIKQRQPDAVVADILTLAPALAAERAGVPWATLIPHVHPVAASGFPPFSFGARLPRGLAGRTLWRAVARFSGQGVELGRQQLNAARRELGLAPLGYPHGGISRELCLVATFPQLEYPRAWAPSEHVVGPLAWEPPTDDLPPLGREDRPLVLVAPSTSQDPAQRLVRAALAGLAELPVRVVAVARREGGLRPGANATLVNWISYARIMPRADVVVCHGGHGTVARSLSCGVPLVVCPAAGDMFENAARVDWAGVGVRVPRRLLSAREVRLGVQRVLGDQRMRERAATVAAWASEHDGPGRAAKLVEEFARQRL